MFQFLYHCSFVCQFFLHYYWYFYNSNQSSGGVLQKVCAKIFSKFIRKHLCYSLILNEVADLRSLTLLTKRFQHRCSLMNFANFPIPLSSKKKKKKTFRRLVLHKHSFRLLSHDDLLLFQKRCHIYFPAEYVLGLIWRLETSASSKFQTLTQKPLGYFQPSWTSTMELFLQK